MAMTDPACGYSEPLSHLHSDRVVPRAGRAIDPAPPSCQDRDGLFQGGRDGGV